MIRHLLCATLLMATTVAYAESGPLAYERVHLNASANEQVENDTVIAVLYAQVESHDVARASDEVNRLIAAAMKSAQARERIKARTLEYRTTPVYRAGKTTGEWQVQQSMRLESRDSAALSALVGELQKTLALRSLDYELSDAARQQVLERLTQRAIQAFKARAQRVTQAWGRERYRLVEMQIGDSDTAPPRPLLRAAPMSATLAAPTIEAGEQQVSVTVQGTIELLR